VTGVSAGTSFISADVENASGRAQVEVIVGMSGVFDYSLTPQPPNTCNTTFHANLTGSFLPIYEEALADGYEYRLTFSLGADGRISVVGRANRNGFDHVLQLVQDAPRGGRYSGREEITGPNGCRAAYLWSLTRR
jgi:hypothetical protein